MFNSRWFRSMHLKSLDQFLRIYNQHILQSSRQSNCKWFPRHMRCKKVSGSLWLCCNKIKLDGARIHTHLHTLKHTHSNKHADIFTRSHIGFGVFIQESDRVSLNRHHARITCGCSTVQNCLNIQRRRFLRKGKFEQ